MAWFWVDVDNPPQAQYLSPIATGLRNRGHSVLITARNHQPTLDVLANRGETATTVGDPFGETTAAKVAGTLKRAANLHRLAKRTLGRPAAVVSTSRSGVLAARTLRAPCFTVLDYEGVELGIFRRSGTTILHPAVVPASVFVERGFPTERLVAFPGLKEDLSFSGLDIGSVQPAKFSFTGSNSRSIVLVRPPSETSHYRVDDSMRMLDLVIDRLAGSDELQVVFAPREPEQLRILESRDWRVPPVVLSKPLPLVELLTGVDCVVTGGGTMLREAAWLGVQGVTLFQGEMPAVDTWLESEGAIRRVGGAKDIDEIQWHRTSRSNVIAHHPEALDRVVEIVLEGASKGR